MEPVASNLTLIRPIVTPLNAILTAFNAILTPFQCHFNGNFHASGWVGYRDGPFRHSALAIHSTARV